MPDVPSTLGAGAPVAPWREPPGEDLGRIIALSDGVFAFALTLLVLQLAVPSFATAGLSQSEVSGRLAAALQGDWPTLAIYGFTFFLIAQWWTVHHRTFRYIERYDNRLVWLNFAVLMEITIFPFVLQVFSRYEITMVAVDLFASVQAITGLTMFAIWVYATAGRRLVSPTLENRVIQYFRMRSLVSPAVFALSIMIAFVSVPLAAFSWLAAIGVGRFLGRYGGM